MRPSTSRRDGVYPTATEDTLCVAVGFGPCLWPGVSRPNMMCAGRAVNDRYRAVAYICTVSIGRRVWVFKSTATPPQHRAGHLRTRLPARR